MSGAEICYPYSDLSSYLVEKESRTVSNILGGEEVLGVARQRRISGAVISPTVVILTSKRVVIVNRFLGGVKSDISLISHHEIVGLRVAHGILFSSIYVRMRGSAGEIGKVFKSEKEEGEINGLGREEADALFKKLSVIVDDHRKGRGSHNYHFAYGNVVNNFAYGSHAWSGRQDLNAIPYRVEDADGTSAGEVPRETVRALPVHTILALTDGSGSPRPVITADDLLIFRMRKNRVEPDEMLIFKMRREHPDLYIT